MLLSLLPQKLSLRNHLLLIFIAAFAVRAATFFFYVQHNERYHQADSMDYHNCAIGLAYNVGQYRVDNLEPIFWRTPAYAWYLSQFYKITGMRNLPFKDNRPAHLLALWVQIFLCSFIPVLLFLLAKLLTGSLLIATITGWLSVFHLGFVLASTYLLTEGLALIPFLLFFIFLYRAFRTYGEEQPKSWVRNLALAALFLGLQTWIRPMGQFVSIVTALTILILDACTWKTKLKKVALFLSIFFACIFPWILRNHTLTGQWFYCPMSGPMMNAFCAPKILRTVHTVPLEVAIRHVYGLTQQDIIAKQKELKGTGKYVCREIMCGPRAWAIIFQHPYIFISDWLREARKATFDLYSSQLAAFAANSFMYDPLEEFLGEKLQACLYKQPMPPFMRLIAWLELLYALLLWFGLFAGLWLFMLYPLGKRFAIVQPRIHMSALWFKTVPFVAGILLMTGAFGYARLRLPVEGLMIILSLTAWFWLIAAWQHRKQNA